ncbi:coxsackievirus and adenovirus receptor homolog isoform X2 [Betta splendens]|uniref:Coxsackievirus and adenovirus receptor homolog isoform X2 n=1 Tax=Betta splendens TaxID=158456 RepID=A0A9W2Y5V2_BETSP|nr:coxsackievirus and adenovirus receptor homolog isoform X2 [Betta splendens]
MLGHGCCGCMSAAFCPFCLCAFLLWAGTLSVEHAQGLQVMSTGPQTVVEAEGDSVTVGCIYTLSPTDTGELDIEWSAVSPDTTKKDQMLLSFSGGTTYLHGDQAQAKGLSFAAQDPSMGDASLSIARLSSAHAATYQCKVKKSPGVDTRKVSLVVMVKPSVPKCWVEGGELVGEAVSLHCNAATGSTPLTYRWRRGGAEPVPAAAVQNSVTGELKISIHSQAFAGIYMCEVNNAVGAERCRINLKANKRPQAARPTAPPVSCCCCCWFPPSSSITAGMQLLLQPLTCDGLASRCRSADTSAPAAATGYVHQRVGRVLMSSVMKRSKSSWTNNTAQSILLTHDSGSAVSAPNRAAMMVGTSVGSLLFFFIMLLFLALCYWKLSSRRRYEKEFSNDISVDWSPAQHQLEFGQ